MIAYNLISATICAVIGLALSSYDANKNSIEVNGETYLPTRFRWLASAGNGFGICAVLLFIQAFRAWIG